MHRQASAKATASPTSKDSTQPPSSSTASNGTTAASPTSKEGNSTTVRRSGSSPRPVPAPHASGFPATSSSHPPTPPSRLSIPASPKPPSSSPDLLRELPMPKTQSLAEDSWAKRNPVANCIPKNRSVPPPHPMTPAAGWQPPISTVRGNESEAIRCLYFSGTGCQKFRSSIDRS